ncbi:radical SAM protein [Halobacteriovorax sp. ZH4_bin.1]|uniref:radical SAM protein n=1 Tax=unclassified Halobacteriovorax TaxID=2639665 RepID=UPI00371DCEF1
MTAKRDEFTIITTYNCNWDCSYCIIDTHKRNKTSPISKEMLLGKIYSVTEGAQVSLSGGEPGLIDPVTMEKVFQHLVKLNCTIDVFTNGLFIKRYGDKYLKYVDEVLYHCVENLDQEIEYPNMDEEQFTYVIIVTNDNHHMVDDFLDKYSHLSFKLSCNSKHGQTLNRGDAFKLFMRNKHRISEDSFETLFRYHCDCNLI